MNTFLHRAAAGRELGPHLRQYRNRHDVVVLGLPRGGVPVAYEVAKYLKAPLDVVIVRKLGAPNQPEYALGAIASGGVVVTNEGALHWADDPTLDATIAAERNELVRRELTYRAGQPILVARNRIAILVDDGAATGTSMLAAIQAVRELGAKKIVVALPVASIDARDLLSEAADEVVCLNTPASFMSVGSWFTIFDQTTDEEVIGLLRSSRQELEEFSASHAG